MRSLALAVSIYSILVGITPVPAFATDGTDVDWKYWIREFADIGCEGVVDLAVRKEGFSFAKAVGAHFGCQAAINKLILPEERTPKHKQQCPPGYRQSERFAGCVSACNEGWVYDSTQSECKSICSAGQVYDRDQRKCILGCPSGRVYDSFWETCNQECPSGEDYDMFYERTCTVCRAGAVYDAAQPPGHRCKL
jgi:hypothetical protein